MAAPPLLFSVFMVLGSVCVVIVKSEELQSDGFKYDLRRNELTPGDQSNLFSPPLNTPPPPPPPSISSPPPPPPYSAPPPPESPPPPFAPPPPAPSPPPPHPKIHRPPPPPRAKPHASKADNHTRHSPHFQPSKRDKEKEKRDRGKEIGYWFAGAAGVLQIGVVGFLVYKRREISKISDRHDNCS